jgi:hypothetical protein
VPKGKEKENMATLRRRRHGCWELQYRDEHSRKKTITLSGRKYKGRIALQLKDVVEVPLFPLLAEELYKLRSIPDSENQEYVINRYSDRKRLNVAHSFTKIAERAGLGKIVRPFDNMRASRATEVYDEWGAKKESLWIGHSEKIAMKCYLMVTDDDYAEAAGMVN